MKRMPHKQVILSLLESGNEMTAFLITNQMEGLLGKKLRVENVTPLLRELERENKVTCRPHSGDKKRLIWSIAK